MLGSKDERALWRSRVRGTDVGTCASLVGALLGLFTGAGSLLRGLGGPACRSLSLIMGLDSYPFGISSGWCLRAWRQVSSF